MWHGKAVKMKRIASYCSIW